jgi:anti-sigma B factor antagonist
MHECEDQAADRGPHVARTRSEVSPAAHPAGASSWAAPGTLSVQLLAADQHRTVLVVHGEIDLGTAPELRKALRTVLEQHTGPVVVDLSEVPFMDSTGVHVLADTLRRLESQNRPLAVVCDEGGQVHRLLKFVGLPDALTVSCSRETALATAIQ